MQYATGMNASSTQLSSEQATAIVMFLFFVAILAVVVYILRSIVVGKLFKKAGQPAWKAWVPVYWHWILLQLGGQPGYWSIAGLLPIVNIVAYVFTCIAMYHIGFKLQKQSLFILWAIFFPLVWYVWLGLDRSKWDESAGAPRRDELAQSNT